ncbi:MAG: DUF1830 domain-containing protein [Microcoleaceae cyanobacterium]
MSQILDPLPSQGSDRVVCCYVNATSQIQVVRISNVPGWYFERVVFPGQRLVFEAAPEGLLEVHTGSMASAIISDTIPCTNLQIDNDEVSQVGRSSADDNLYSAKSNSASQSTATDAAVPALSSAD